MMSPQYGMDLHLTNIHISVYLFHAFYRRITQNEFTALFSVLQIAPEKSVLAGFVGEMLKGVHQLNGLYLLLLPIFVAKIVCPFCVIISNFCAYYHKTWRIAITQIFDHPITLLPIINYCNPFYSMSYNNHMRHTRAHHNDIISKTEIALQAIKKYEQRSNRFFQKNAKLLKNPYSIFKQIDSHYTRYSNQKQLKLDKVTRVQLFPHNEQYYCISTELVIFPVRIWLKGVRNQGIMYVGYDREYPGVERVETGRSGGSGERSGDESEKRVYDCKFVFNKDIMCVLKNQKKKPINKIFLTIVAQKEMLLVNLKFDYIGYEPFPEDIHTRPKRAFTEGNINLNSGQIGKPFHFPSPTKKVRNETLYENQLLLTVNKKFGSFSPAQLKRSKTQAQGLQQGINMIKQTGQDYQQQVKQVKNFIKMNSSNILVHKRQNSRELIQQKRQKSLQLMQRIKANKQQLEEYKQKQKEIKQGASKLKKAIEQYQKIYKEQRVRDKKALYLMTTFLYMSNFVQKSNQSYNKETQSVTKAFSVRYLIKKFTKGLRKKYIENILMIGNFKARNQMGCMHLFQLACRIVEPISKQKGAKLIYSAFDSLQPALILNHSLNQSSRYRQSCRNIQRRWILKYRARVAMLQNFAMRHVEAMLKDYPHLRLGYGAFKTGNFCHRVCYDYMVDQSVKFRHIYDAYRKRINEIDQFIKENEKIREFNKGKPESKKKNYLDIPKKPTPPQHRFFRNLDILKSMLRGWFEIEYKKILKKSASGK